MLNIHLTNHTFKPFEHKIEEYLPFQYLGEWRTKFETETKEIQIVDISYSEALKALVIFTQKEIRIVELHNDTTIVPIPEGNVVCAELNNGGDFAFISTDAHPYLVELETKEFTKIEGIEGIIQHIAFRDDNKFIAVATDKQLLSIDQNKQIHGKHSQDNITGITWNPAGTWIAVSSGKNVRFFEKNCEHRTGIEFDTELSTIQWGKEKDIVAVGDKTGYIHFLYTKNRKWYKKFMINTSFVGYLNWSTPYVLEYRNQQGIGHLTINNVVDSNENDIFVVESNNVFISHWSKALIPPPLAHESREFDSQVTCLGISNEKVAVFTMHKLQFIDDTETYDLPMAPVQTATFRGGKLLFAADSHLFEFDNGKITELNNTNGFISFLTPNYTVYKGAKLVNASDNKFTILADYIYAFTDNDGQKVMQMMLGDLIVDGATESSNVYSYLATGKLIAYTHDISKFTVKYYDEKHTRGIENYAHVLYFNRKLYSIVTQMQRGNTETNAPHVIVEHEVKSLIKEHKYNDTLFISKRYQVPFTRIIRLGEVSIPELLQQVPDSKLRPFISVLTCIPPKSDTPPKSDEEHKEREREIMECAENKSFVYKILSHLFSIEFNDKTEWKPEFAESKLAISFFSVASICFVLLDKSVNAVAFACQMKDPQTSKQALDFLLTLFDADNLFDISMRTYDTKTIATVGHYTMREPSLFIPMLEKFNKMPRDLMIAKIHNKLGDYGTAVKYYAKLDDQRYVTKARDICLREKCFDEGLESFKRGSEEWLEILKQKLEQLEADKKYKEVAIQAISSNNEDIILKYINAICLAGNHELARRRISKENYNKIFEVLKKQKKTEEAAFFCLNYLDDQPTAGGLFLSAQMYDMAEKCGVPVEKIADSAYKYLSNLYKRNAKLAQDLHEQFEQTKKKEETHHPDSSKRSGKKKESRGLPAIISKLEPLLPTQKDDERLTLAQTYLTMVDRNDDAKELKQLYNAMARAVYPIPSLPEGQKPLVPEYLKPTFGYS
ncbi:hypothetical protein TVAG_303440 [Trichomonas vaginalis G3]|uniref:Elongator complex protein 1 n=1 Tax=Trichomonas vaginalis (strain ATCC PRA-98 / G3) TaxID=412133 RepID=A2DR26_TRIV3|nr:phosphorylase kinase regulator protein [Trichomonas vaginalis G3]EAY17125.1 hypothetical protein TVAG_303440 [Trichomonas vaginalis G3]KAI5508835.1 phosphorylase kinase regulator protein [Trichomonas vaginalis G3]|eukprot:XP_001329348.1 hypothetical protein [Trichomonas vaginalis G3]